MGNGVLLGQRRYRRTLAYVLAVLLGEAGVRGKLKRHRGGLLPEIVVLSGGADEGPKEARKAELRQVGRHVVLMQSW